MSGLGKGLGSKRQRQRVLPAYEWKDGERAVVTTVVAREGDSTEASTFFVPIDSVHEILQLAIGGATVSGLPPPKFEIDFNDDYVFSGFSYDLPPREMKRILEGIDDEEDEENDEYTPDPDLVGEQLCDWVESLSRWEKAPHTSVVLAGAVSVIMANRD
jgi:hypothetical protein